MSSDYHASTIAMSLYNIIAIGDARTIEEARAALARRGMLISKDELVSAAGELVARGLLIGEGEVLNVTGPKGHVVVSRDRTGDGWKNWQTAPYRAPQARSSLVGTVT